MTPYGQLYDQDMCGDEEGRVLGDWKSLHLGAQAFIRIRLPHLPGVAVLLTLLSHQPKAREQHSCGHWITTLSVRNLPRSYALRRYPPQAGPTLSATHDLQIAHPLNKHFVSLQSKATCGFYDAYFQVVQRFNDVPLPHPPTLTYLHDNKGTL